MGIFESLPSGLLTFLTWLVLWIAASFLILILSIFIGRLLGEFVDGILGAVK
jgi:hypothetical protein